MNLSARTPNVGLIITDIEDRSENRIYSWQEIADMTRTAEAVGFDSVWIPDHLIHEPPGIPKYGIWEAWSLIAALAAITEKIRIGPHVLCTGWRNPALIAKMADTVDEISGGRLILALGAGWHEPEYTAFGFPFDHRIGRFADALEIIHSLLRTNRSTLDGQFYQTADCELRPRGPSAGGPPIMIGTIAGTPLGEALGIQKGGDRVRDLVVKYADSWNCPLMTSPELIPPVRQMMDDACIANGRDPATLLRTYATLVNLPGWQGEPGLASVRKRRVALDVMSGSYEETADFLRRFAQEGASEVHVQIDPESPKGIEQFGRVLELL